MHPEDASGRELQPRSRDVPDERFDIPPVDELPVLGVVAAKAPGQEAPEPGPEARVDAGYPPGAAVAHQFDLARPDQVRGADIDHAVIEDVRTKQHLTGTPLELRKVELGRRGLHRGRPQLLDPVGRQEQLAAADPCRQTDHRRGALGGVEPGNDVLDLSEPLTR